MKEQYIERIEALNSGTMTEADIERLRTQCLLDELVGIRNEIEERTFKADFYDDAVETKDLTDVLMRIRDLIIRFG